MPKIKLEEALLEEDEQQEIERECMEALGAAFHERPNKRPSPAPMVRLDKLMKKFLNEV